MKNLFRQTASQDLSSAALADTYVADKDMFCTEVLLKASVNITETVTVTFDSLDGSTYDVILDTSALTADQNYVFRPAEPIPLKKGDGIKIACTNANTTGIVYSTIKMTREQ